mgnify:CR=1 FL=1
MHGSTNNMIEKIKTFNTILLKIIWHSFIPYKVKILFNKSPHGDMANLDYAQNIFYRHVKKIIDKPMGTILEIGPGDSPHIANLSLKYGFNNAVLIDNACYFDSSEYEKYNKSFHYYTNGIDSLKKLKNNSINFCFSHTVLQHIHKDEIDIYIKNLHRVMKNNSISSHYIDFKDMLFGKFNHLLVNDFIWESSIIKNCSFYTNRLRKSEIINLFKKYGFHVTVLKENYIKSNKYPKKSNLNKIFSEISHDDLSCSSIHILVRKK